MLLLESCSTAEGERELFPNVLGWGLDTERGMYRGRGERLLLLPSDACNGDAADAEGDLRGDI